MSIERAEAISIIKDYVSTMIEDIDFIKIINKESHISIGTTYGSLYDIYFNKENKFFILREKYRVPGHYNDKYFDILLPIEILPFYLKPIFNNIIIPNIILLYEKNILKDIPEIWKPKIDINLSLIDIDIFKKLFDESSEKESNSETAQDIDIKETKDGIEIRFEINARRYGKHEGNKVKINNKGYISVQLCELLDGGGIELTLKDKIKKIITI